MPNRVIKESIRTSKKVNALSDFEFRLWIYLITYADDFGRGSADPELLKGLVFPRRKGITESQIQKTLDGLANNGMVTLYTVEDEPYFYFPNWDKHQRVQTKKSRFPNPEEADSPSSTVTHGEPPLEYNTIQSNTNTNTNPNPNTKKGADRADRSALDIALDDFAKARKAMKKPLTDKARELTIKELEKLAPGNEAMQIAIINQSIQRGWQGVFALKDDAPHPASANKEPQKPVSWKDGPTYLPDWAVVDE